MTITIAHTDYQALWQESNLKPQHPDPVDGCDRIEVCPDYLGTGYIRKLQLRGIELNIFNYSVREDVIVTNKSGGTEWEFGFHLSGNRSGKQTGENFVSWGYFDEESHDYPTHAGERILKPDICFDSPDTLSGFIPNHLKSFPPELMKAIEGSNREHFWNIDKIEVGMRLALEQMLNCPYQGCTKQIYLASKCLELVALKLAQLNEEQRLESSQLLKPDDVERIYHARDILLCNLDRPPSLLELARQVGLNDYKLKLGFRQVFGTTAFGYLHEVRMERSRQLLLENRMSVKEISQAVGYVNQSRFAAAFRKRFGVTPKSYGVNRGLD
ncbi:AraC family transcriptional regulator [Gloeocapsopsis sp. IPPAS B-1203]|uniref:helix-turn-helix transcriptional regulator n=1 Tax=Gloeocapsopsis sp. IPPAS B-1203 TaxID=2049454 RepID=UPI000C17C734|nr:AraC family transcriptional regulator [Gloeocapsopsis sp. IPPAS B-1203]PIG94144.1 transcriptional regulator [Gloeocapsopsis sp. IPPAS B-1203]